MANLSLRLEQKLKLSQFQRLTIQLMQLHRQDLTDFLEKEVTENPLLDICYPDVRKKESGAAAEKPIDNLPKAADSLETSLLKQLRVQNVPKAQLLAAGLVISHLDEKGFFTADLDELGQNYHLSLAEMEKGLALVQSFDPPGIAARNIQEALLIQTRRQPKVPQGTEILLTEHYGEFLKGQWQKIEQDLQLTVAELEAIRIFLKKLSLQPASQSESETAYVRPDIEVYWDNEKLAFRFLEELPAITFRDDLYQQYDARGDKKTKTYIRRAKRRFLDLQTALQYRRESMSKVFTSLLTVQQAYFAKGKLQPFLQRDLAKETGLSEATVSRICRHSYLLYQGHTYPVKFFFSKTYGTEDTSYQTVIQAIQQILAKETADYAYSDQEITDILAKEQIHLARRTVTKFRQKLHIPNSRIRRQLK